MKRRVVVTGLGVVTSLSCRVDLLWQRVLAGESGINKLQLVDTSDFKVKIGGDIQDWNPVEYLPAKEMKRIDRFSQFAMVAGADAVTDSGLNFEQEQGDRCGVIVGSGIGGIGEIEAQMIRLVNKGPDRVSAMTVPKMMVNAAGSNLSIEYGLRGPNYTVATACASANNAMGDALRAIQNGVADIVITGGTEAAVTRVGLSAFQNIKALSMRNDEPAKASRPFDLDRDGFVLSEGAGMMIFEEYEHAKARSANIHAEVLGYGFSSDAYHITQPDEQGVGAARSMQDAVADSEIEKQVVDYINAHGTSTPLGDKAETIAVRKVFHEHANSLSISSSKSQLGHSLGASGGIEMVLTVKSLKANVVPPTINLETPDPDCDLDYTPNEPRERQVNVAMSNSFGFGGHNASIVVAKPGWRP